ncbi:MAG: tRNA 2-thiouridine(34) synthase MnmA [bacterium]|nr:tRNA 2-thiouridine(34) synthase MnmA [bacterium]
MEKALVAMSGGVDSSVCAALMMKNGYECMGVTMKLYENETIGEPKENSCCAQRDTDDARKVCERLGMPYYVLNFKDAFASEVIDRFVAAYEAGDTPNPCIDCNRYMKFDRLYQRAKELACDVIATGHYARVEQDTKTGRWLLKKAVNTAKDQSYVLAFLSQEQLSHTRFPLGDFSSKDEVRAVADEYGFVNAKKHDSQDICFVPDGDYAAFMERYTGKCYPPGDFVDENGNCLGQHKGIIRYTIGQRKGLGLSLPAPLYVCRKCMDTNEVVLTQEAAIFSDTCIVKDFNWIAYDEPTEPVRVTAKTRYRAKEAAATAFVQPDGTVKLVFDEPQRAITTGQAAVLYDGELVVGGGTIIE